MIKSLRPLSLVVSLILLPLMALTFSGCAPTQHDKLATIQKFEKTMFKPGTLTLKDVIDSVPVIAQHKPSFFVARIGGTIVPIHGQNYEIRFFFFEQSHPVLPANISFGEFAREYNLLSTQSRLSSRREIPVEFFTQSSELADQGIFYMISLRKVLAQPVPAAF